MTTANGTLPTTKTVVLTTFRRNGSGVSTPVNLAYDDGHAYFRTWDTSGKAKRLRRQPDVEVAASNARGEPKSEPIAAHVLPLSPGEEVPARRALRRQHPILHGALVPLVHRAMRAHTVHYELLPGR